MEKKIKKTQSENISENHLGGYIPGGDENTWFPELWEWIVKKLDVRSVLDIGCGEGHAIKYFKGLGCDVLGIDGSSIAIKDSVVPQNVVKHDFCKGDYTLNKKYDITWSCEFVEHVKPKYLYNFLKTFKFSNKYVFMSHAQPGQCGWHHVNCRSDNYWIKIFSKIGFKFDSELTKISRKLAKKGHFAKSGLVFVRGNSYVNSYAPSEIYLRHLHIKLKTIDCIIFGPTLIYIMIDKNIGVLGILLNRHYPHLYSFLKKLKNKGRYGR